MEEKFMEAALQESKKAYEKKEVPVGAVLVKNGKIIARAHNLRETKNLSTAHAEILAIREAEKILQNWRLDDCEMYVTLEPCPMCAWAILQSRIKAVYFGSFDKKYGAFGSAINLANFSDNKPKIYSGIMEEECDKILEDFWKKKRNK